MAVPDWPPTHIMKDLFDKNYKPTSGNNVTLDVDFIPWPDYYTRLNASLTSGEKKYKMAVSDSQWLGAFIEGGYYLKINKYVDADPGAAGGLQGPAPGGDGVLLDLSVQVATTLRLPADAGSRGQLLSQGRVLRRRRADEFQGEVQLQAALHAEEMDQIDWDNCKDIGEFFQRKKGEMLVGKPLDDDFYGIEFQVGKGYDFFTTSVNDFIWQHGGDIWDETKQPNAHAVGVVNSRRAVKAFEHLLSFVKYMPPVAKTGNMDIFKTDELFRAGKVASNLEWIGFAESSIIPRPRRSPTRSRSRNCPARRPTGRRKRWSVIGGQPFVLTTWNTDAAEQGGARFRASGGCRRTRRSHSPRRAARAP